MTAATGGMHVELVRPGHMEPLAAFAQERPLAYNDFASIAILQPDDPRVWAAWSGELIVAAAIDDGLAMSVGGNAAGLGALAAHIPGVAEKLVIAGREPEVHAFVGDALGSERRSRPEHFMTITRDELRLTPEEVPLRVAEEDDLELLTVARARALEEEYGIPVPEEGDLYAELSRAVKRAVAVRGVAIWVEDGGVAFTAQLIAKTEEAAMFGDLFTDPGLRGSGRATRALVAFCSWLMSESRVVTLRVGVDNTPALRLYERCGFTTTDRFLSSLRADQPSV